MPKLSRSLRTLGLCTGAAILAGGLAVADPVPIRPLKPREKKAQPAQPQKLPRCQGQERGLDINGPDFTGTGVMQHPPCAPLPQLKSVQLKSGVSLDGQAVVKDFVLSDGRFFSPTAKAADMKGALFLGATEHGKAVRLRIDAVEPAPDGKPQTPVNENADLVLYRVVVQQGVGGDPSSAGFHPNKGPTGEWSPLCPEGKLALAVPGVWDFHVGDEGAAGKTSSAPHDVTFACVGSAIAKCVMLMGYRPWKSQSPAPGAAAVSLDALHQACVRAVRADYCGDGESMTQAGEEVNFYDRFGIERDEKDWPMEAAWGPGGALCVSSTRLTTAPENPRTGRPGMKVRDYIQKHCPQRFSEKPCQKDAQKDALLWTEVTTKP